MSIPSTMALGVLGLSSVSACECPGGETISNGFPPCWSGPPTGIDCAGPPGGGTFGGGFGVGGVAPVGGGGFGPPPGGTTGGVPTSLPSAANELGNVGTTTVAGFVTEGVASSIYLPVGEDIFGPFEAGFGAQQSNILQALGCYPASLGYLPGGVDTEMSERMVAHACGVTLPRTENGIRLSLLDDCGGHTQYHFHERLKCLYDESGAHSPQIGQGLDTKFLYGKWEDYSTQELPLLDACGGHWGTTPDSPYESVYHYHVQDQAPFTFGCYGPNPDDSLVTLDQCRALYDGCGDGDITTYETNEGSVEYDPWCPCYDGDGSNVGDTPLQVFSATSEEDSEDSEEDSEEEASEEAATAEASEDEDSEEEDTVSSSCTDSGSFWAGYGVCSTYAEGLTNHPYCELDTDIATGVVASLLCCASCNGVCVDSMSFNIGFGECDTYTPGSVNHFYCTVDKDDDNVYAAEACCSACTPAGDDGDDTPAGGDGDDECVDSVSYNAGWGKCDTYIPGSLNHGYCTVDKDDDNVYAAEACCSACTPAVDECEDLPFFNAGYGSCATYASGLINHNYCSVDSDSGVLAQDACCECK